MADKTRRGGKKNRKHGRNKEWCQKYRARGQREVNKRRKQERLQKRSPECQKKYS